MVRKILCVCFVLCFVSAVSASAEQKPSYFHTSIGFESYYHEYKEPGVMKNEGAFYGVSYSASYEKKLLLRFEGLFAYGKVDYSSATSGDSDDIDDICADNRGILGYVIFDDGKTKLIPFIGFGYRFLQDDSENQLTNLNYIGYLRESNYYYSPIGIEMTFKLNNGWSLHPAAEYDYFWSGEQESYLGYLAGYEDITNDQEDGYGYRLSLALRKDTPRFDYEIKMFYRFWDLDDSEVTVDSWGRSWIEPDNETREFGLNFSILF